MPYAQCPKCGKPFHMLITDADRLRAWKEQYAAEIERDEMPKLQCFECWKESGMPGLERTT
jgi:hypothetical protein